MGTPEKPGFVCLDGRYYDREEWWDVARTFRPDMNRSEFERVWKEAEERKAERAATRVRQ